MTFIDALKTGRIAVHNLLIGGYLLLDGKIYHRDNVLDFNDLQWIKDNNKSQYDDYIFVFRTGMPLSIFLDDNWSTL